MSNNVISNIISIMQNMHLTDAIDILLLTVFIYYIIKFIKGRRANQILAGLIVILILYLLSSLFKLIAFNWFLNFIITYSIFALIVIFSDEIKAYLASLGARLPFQPKRLKASKKSIDEIIDSIESMSREQIGGLIVFERNVSLKEYVSKGTILNASISKQLIISIFSPKTPLHDGAIIISKDKVAAASVVLPLPQDVVERKKNFGTRHLAAISISKSTDAIVIAISEETGIISVAHEGNLVRNYSMKSLENLLIKELEAE